MDNNYLNSLSKEEEMKLLLAAKAGDNSAATALLSQYEPLAKSAAGRVYYSDDYNDIFADAFVALYEAIMTYDEGKGVPFAAWARAKVYGDLRTKANRINREMKRREEPHQCLHGRWSRRNLRRIYRMYTRLAERLHIA